MTRPSAPLSRRRLLAAALAATVLPAQAQTAAGFPAKPIRILVPFTAGSGADSASRYYGDALAKLLGQQVVVENRPGGSGVVAVQAVRAAPADGHTILMGSNSPVVVNAITVKDLPYDPFKHLRPLYGIAISPVAFAVRADSPYKTLADLVAAMRSGKKALQLGNYSAGYQLVAAWLGSSTGLAVDHIPYKGGAQMLTDVVGGQLGGCRAWGRACVEAGNGLSLGAKHSHALRHGAHSQRRISPLPASTQRAGAIFGAIRRCRLVVGGNPTPRRRLGWHRNSPRRRLDPKPDSLLDVGVIDFTGTTELMKGGRLRVLAITAAQRDPKYPDIPTMKESGYPEFETGVWSAFFLRAETPDDIVEKLAAALHKSMTSDAGRAYQASLPSTALLMGPKDLGEFQLREYQRFKKVAEAAGIKAE